MLRPTDVVDAVKRTALGRRVLDEFERRETQERAADRRSSFAKLKTLEEQRAATGLQVSRVKDLEREEREAEERLSEVRRERIQAESSLRSLTHSLDSQIATVKRTVADLASPAIRRLLERVGEYTKKTRLANALLPWRSMADPRWRMASNHEEIKVALDQLVALRQEAEALWVADLDGAELDARLEELWSKRPAIPKVQRPMDAVLVAGEEAPHVIADLKRRRVVRR